VLIYPNPVGVDGVLLRLSGNIDSYELSTTTGQRIVMKQLDGSSNEIRIHTAHLPKGVYVLKIQSGINQYSKKLIRK
jgi:hypothetical protein